MLYTVASNLFADLAVEKSILSLDINIKVALRQVSFKLYSGNCSLLIMVEGNWNFVDIVNPSQTTFGFLPTFK